jgi:hypothetical protein
MRAAFRRNSTIDRVEPKKAAETALEELKAQESLEDDVEDAIGDLKDRLDSFRRGFTKASGMTRKILIHGLIHGIVVTPKGLSIEYRLRHGLNSTGGTGSGSTATPGTENNVIPLESHRRHPLAATASEPTLCNEGITGSRVAVNGSESGT